MKLGRKDFYGIFLRESTFGFEDGTVTAIGVITGVAGAETSFYVLLLAWTVAALAGGISMAAGTYLSIKSQREFYECIEKERGDHIHEELKKPVKGSFIMFISFVIGSILPILPYSIMQGTVALYSAIILATVSLFGFGALKGSYSKRNWIKSGLEMMVIGMIAASAGYLIGALLFRV